jgi:hypothetical protein
LGNKLGVDVPLTIAALGSGNLAAPHEFASGVFAITSIFAR